MSRRPSLKSSQRFVMYIPNRLRQEIEGWVTKKGITLAEFGRDAFEAYLRDIKRKERDAQLAETCRLFDRQNNSVYQDWAPVEAQNWPV